MFRYYTNKIELFKEKKYKEIKQRYFIPWDKEKSIQDRLINKMSESGRFNEIYIGKFIPAANLYFNCDFKTSQANIFYKFIISKNIGETFKINDIITFYQKSDKTKEYVDRQFYNVSIELDDIKRFKQVILDYLNYLCGLDIIKSEVANDYYSYYDIKFRIKR